MSARFEPDFSIDLHGYRPDAAMELVRRAVESGRYRGKTLEVIHGQGGGVLREMTRKYAQSSRAVKRYCGGEELFLPGGGGVTIFYL